MHNNSLRDAADEQQRRRSNASKSNHRLQSFIYFAVASLHGKVGGGTK
jgi:hypothetical protein